MQHDALVLVDHAGEKHIQAITNCNRYCLIMRRERNTMRINVVK